MAGAMQRTAAQVYEHELPDSSVDGPLICVGRISDVYWDDAERDIPDGRLRGFTLVDSDLPFGKGLSILNYYRQPYVDPRALPKMERSKYRINKFVRVTFEVFDTYEEAVGDGASAYAGHPCIPHISDH